MSLLSRLAVQAARAYGILSSSDKNAVPASYLVVAGGGAGARRDGAGGGGGGAGGFRTGTSTLSTLNTYSITVGAGGTTAGDTVAGGNGNNSFISGTGLTTITSTGGGGGGATNSAGASGGSGGGGTHVSGAGGAGNTPSTTPSQGNNGGASDGPGGGGGGAGAVGSNSSNPNGGNGGNGSSSSISGSSVTYAGGGGGGSNGATGGTGGTGGGGAGSSSGTAGVAGTTNLGGGGGGSGYLAVSPYAGAGGSGIVIISYASATPRFVGGTLTTSGGNQIHTFTSSGTLSPLTPVTASYLVVAGGGGAGGNYGGGGGAGGLLTSSTTLYSGATYVVTVGGGGAVGGFRLRGANGSNSVLSGTGITTVTSTGGGGGGGGDSISESNANSGGSGGGGGGGNSLAGSSTGAAGAGNTPSTSPSQGSTGGTGSTDGLSYRSGGGGGGATAVGSNDNLGVGGAGGAGTASSISGSSVTYAGGGGGGGTTSNGAGGAGGGGSSGTNGTANTGGGGGGTTGGTAGAGGSGTVIISYAGSQVFNGGLVTSSGGNTIHTFNATGALTPVTNNLNNSLRFRASNSAYLSRTPTVASNQRTWTWSAWVKRGDLASEQMLFGAGNTYINLTTGNLIECNFRPSATSYYMTTTQVIRDPSAWYHIVVVFDSTQATAANRAKMYINGNQVSAFSVSSYTSMSQNMDATVNSVTAHNIGRYTGGGNQFDGYMTDINFIDGQALEPYYFGNNDAYGNWKPIKYTGMYGTNGFYLTFADASAATAAAIGKDSSGNGNNWTPSGISVTAGITYDAMTDVPTNTSATVGNYATLSAIDYKTTAPSNGGLTEVAGNGIFGYARATQALPSSNKTYAECTVLNNVSNSAQFDFGVATNDVDVSAIPTTSSWVMEFQTTAPRRAYSNGSLAFSIGGVLVAGDTCQIAFDMSTGNGWMGVNNVWYNSTGGTTGDPSTGVNPTFTGLSGLTLFPVVRVYGQQVDLNFGQRTFTYTPPTGYVRLNTYNLPTPTILKGNLYMDATLYTGTGTTQVIVNQGQFKPDFVWVKDRQAAQQHLLFDSVRGVHNFLSSNSTAAEGTNSTTLTSFNSNGFGLGTNNTSNQSGISFVGWQWQAGQGTNTSNTSGSITSTVSVNATAGFSVITFTAPGSGSFTVGHGLGVAPKFIITKTRSNVDHWLIWHTSLGSNGYLIFTTNASATNSAIYNGLPTSTLINYGSYLPANGSTYVSYAWAEIDGFSKFGSYTGNGSTDGPFVYTGFRPKFVLIKRTDVAGNWRLHDTSRDTYNVTQAVLYPNLSNAEATGSNEYWDLLSNGFKLRNSDSEQNASGGTYIFMAYAENPFKNANAR